MRRTKGCENDFNAQLAKQQKDRILLEKDIAEVAGVFEVHRKLKSRRSKRKSPSWRLEKCYIEQESLPSPHLPPNSLRRNFDGRSTRK